MQLMELKVIFGLDPDPDSNLDPNSDPKLTAGRILSRIRNKHFRSATLDYFVCERDKISEIITPR
jgi:hypothetical protein